MTAAIAPCTQCGLPRQTRANHPTLCNYCARGWNDDSALPPGRWVRRGLTSIFIPDPTPEPQLDGLWAVLEHNLLHEHHPPLGILCDCGCLLTHRGESCPACLVWAERDATRSSWAAEEHANRTTTRKEAA